MTEYLSRSQWTSTSASGAALSGSSLRGVAVHWPGTSQATIGAASRSSIANRLRSYRSFHVNTRGWRDIGYNLAIDQAGRIWMLRSTQWHGNLVGAHAASGSNPNANHHYVGVLLLLGASETPSAAMVAAFRDWYHTRFLKAWPGRIDVRGHGQVRGAQTSCPGSRARAAISTMTAKPSGNTPPSTGDDDMKADERDALMYIRKTLANGTEGRIKHPHNDGSSSIFYGVQETWEDTYALRTVPDELEALRRGILGSSADEIKALIETKHAEAEQQRQVIADTMTTKLDAVVEATQGSDPAEAKLAAILEILGVDA